MKKICLLTILIILIPYIIVNIFIQNYNSSFKFVSNMVIRVKDMDSGKISKVNFEDYIVGVVSAEMPVSFEMEALKAQAVVARSYAMNKIKNSKNKKYDIVDTVLNQVYLSNSELKKNWGSSYSKNIKKIKKAVNNTKGEYLEYKGNIVQAYFFSTSTGVTENSEEVWVSKLPYLRSVESVWDEYESPVFNSKENFSLSDFYTKLDLPYKKSLKIKVLKKTSTGRTKLIKINGVSFTGDDITSLLKLRSNYFSIKKDGNNVVIDVKGYGHGVGMSQYGANGMAKEGYKYDKILKHYYQGVKIKKI